MPLSEFDYGKFAESVTQLQRQLSETQEKLENLHQDVTDIKMKLAEVRGGWRLLTILGAVLSAAAGYLANHLFGKTP